MLQARYVGANFASDAFLVAFRLPNMFRAFFAEGAFSSAFIPMFNRKLAESKGERAAALDFAERSLSVLFAFLAVMTVIMLVAAWPLTALLSGGFHKQHPTHEQFAFAVSLSRITIPYLMLICLASLLGEILNSLEKFWVNAAAPILLNIAMIVGLFVFHGTPAESARVQAITVPIGGVLQLAWLFLACRAAGVSLRPRMPRIDAEVRRLMESMSNTYARHGHCLAGGTVGILTLIALSLFAEPGHVIVAAKHESSGSPPDWPGPTRSSAPNTR